MMESLTSQMLQETRMVYLFGMENSTREWIIQQVPEAQFSLVRKEGLAIACYGNEYHAPLSQDYDLNASTGVRTVLCLTHPCCDSYMDLLQLHVRHIIYPGAPFASEAMRLAIFAPKLLSSQSRAEFFSLPAGKIEELEEFSVRTSGDVEDIMERSTLFFQQRGHSDTQADAAALVVKEAVTNSLFHGFREVGSHERKYDPANFSSLDERDSVAVCLAKTGNSIVLRVSDNAGSLSPLRVGNSLDRQKTERGLFDNRGRGFYLMRHLTQRAVIIVQRGVATALELYFMKDQPEEQEPVLRNFEFFQN
jgi:anti-sigma regulatory factor (Ser/Thr protein kinase)